MNSPEPPGWRTLDQAMMCSSPYLKVTRELVSTPSRSQGVTWMVVRRPVAAVVAPRTPGGNFLLIRQERVAVRKILWEFPAGQVDAEVTDSSIRETALRELGEEAGVNCMGELTALGSFYSSVGFTNECCHLFLASDVMPRDEGPAHDQHEAILEVRAFSADELRAMVADGEIVDSNTLALYARLQAKRLIQ